MTDHEWLPRWRGESNWHEAYFVTLTDPTTGLGAWLRLTITVQHGQAAVAQWAMVTVPGMPELVVRKIAISLDAWKAGVAGLSEGFCGECGGDAPHVAWDLRWPQPGAVIYPYPYAWMYRAPLPSTKYVTLGTGLPCTGRLRIGTDDCAIQQATAHIGHVWGPRMADSWAWAAVGGFTEAVGSFEAISARIPIGPVVTPPLTIARLHVGDVVYRFDRWAGWLRQQTRWGRDGWELVATQKDARLQCHIQRHIAPIAGVTYTNPAGGKRYCYNSVATDAVIELFVRAHGRWTPRHRLTCHRTMAYEHVASQPDPTLPLHL